MPKKSVTPYKVAPPPDYTLGPCMKLLNERQRAFVVALLDIGTNNFTQAAAAAGYKSDNANSLRVCASNLAHDARIQAALQEEARKRIQSGTIMAASILLEIANDKSVKATDRLKAAGMILNRAGLHETTESRVTVQVTDTDKNRIERIKTLAGKLGLDPEEVLNKAGIVIDAEYEDTTQTFEEDEPEVITGTEGLEDLL